MNMAKIVVTMTTVPERLNTTLPVALKSILNMNTEDYEVHLNIPHKHTKTGKEYVIPQSIVGAPRLKIFDGLEDQGPKTKILPTIKRLEDDAIIITADDDIIYNKEMINYHLKMREKYNDSAIGFSGTRGNIMHYFTRSEEHTSELQSH